MRESFEEQKKSNSSLRDALKTQKDLFEEQKLVWETELKNI